MEYKDIELIREEGIALIYLNRPKVLNALSETMMVELVEALKETEEDPNIRVLILTGRGQGFCAGADLNRFIAAQQKGKDHKKKLGFGLLDLPRAFVQYPKPIIAAINGYAFGAGWNLALASDIIIASEDAKFSQAFVKMGLVSDMGGMYFLPRFVSLSKAKELMFVGETIDAKEAERIGTVNRVVPKDDLERVARELAKKIALEPLKPIGLMKKILDQSAHLDLPSLLALEAQAQEICSQTDDHIKRIEAFLERRKKSLKQEKRRK